MITEEEYRNITGATVIDKIKLPEFTFSEVQGFLLGKGYIVEVFEASAIVESWTYNQGGGAEDKKLKDEKVRRILARKPNEQLPLRNDDNIATRLDFRNVFKEQIKAKLLSL